ncbi:hypothetical protein PS1_020609 [Malus domestica]
MVMVPTPGWNPGPMCFGTISPERGIPPLPHEDIPFRTPRQLDDFNTIRDEEVPELMLTKDAQAWMNQFLCQIGEKKGRTPRPCNFHANMTYVLLAMFYAEPYQPVVMMDDYLVQELMMALVNIEEVSKEESSLADLHDPMQKEPERVYSDKMMFKKPSLALANHLKPIYMTANLEGVFFQKGVDR